MTGFLFYKAEELAKRLHSERNQLYDNKPYQFHLKQVVDEAGSFTPLLRDWSDIELAIAGCWIHDLIEDCGVTYNDVQELLGKDAAEISYLLATPKGRSRKERHSDAYYQEIAINRVATFVKIADRLANVSHAYNRQSSVRQYEMYRLEQSHFEQFLRPAWPEFEPMWLKLTSMLLPIKTLYN